MNWRVRDEAGNLNWGLITFGVLSGACAAVWGAMLVQYFAYCRCAGGEGVVLLLMAGPRRA